MMPRLPNHKTCCGCSACRSICPTSAITMTPDNEGFLQPVIDQAKCVHCGKCEKVCPVLHHGKPRKPLAVYAAKAKDDELRAGSASGGIFTLLALDVLKRGGVVFGAGFDHSDWRVIHKAAHNEEELDDLRGSKYVQSDVGDTYKETKQLLDDGKEVLYSGCPCQIAALLNFLGKPYPNLTTVDLVCHGVPSPLAWRKYLDDREREAGAKITRTLARRYCGWQEFAPSFDFENDQRYSRSNDEDTYITAFFRHWNLRLSCYRCPLKNNKSGSDITLGDNWSMGIAPVSQEFSLGVSLVFQNTSEGKFLSNFNHNIDKFGVNKEKVKRYNWTFFKSPKWSRLRSITFNTLSNKSFDDTVHILCRMRDRPIIVHLSWWLKRLVINFEINKW